MRLQFPFWYLWNSQFTKAPKQCPLVTVCLAVSCIHLLSWLQTADNSNYSFWACSGAGMCQWKKQRIIPCSELFFKSPFVCKKALVHSAHTDVAVFHFFLMHLDGHQERITLSGVLLLSCAVTFLLRRHSLFHVYFYAGKKKEIYQREIFHALKSILFPTTTFYSIKNETNMRNLSIAVVFFELCLTWLYACLSRFTALSNTKLVIHSIAMNIPMGWTSQSKRFTSTVSNSHLLPLWQGKQFPLQEHRSWSLCAMVPSGRSCSN